MKTNKIILTSLAAILVAGTALPSFAAPGREGAGRHGGKGGMMQEMMFVRLLKTADTNKDAKITKEEVAARQEALFAEIDTDRDGNLTPGELRTYRKTKMDAVREERTERREQRQKEMAANGSQTDDNGRPADRDNRRHDGGRWGMHHGKMGAQMGGFQLIRQADTDENGQFSKAEVTAAVDKMFARMDRNGDGVLTIDDMPDRPF